MTFHHRKTHHANSISPIAMPEILGKEFTWTPERLWSAEETRIAWQLFTNQKLSIYNKPSFRHPRNTYAAGRELRFVLRSTQEMLTFCSIQMFSGTFNKVLVLLYEQGQVTNGDVVSFSIEDPPISFMISFAFLGLNADVVHSPNIFYDTNNVPSTAIAIETDCLTYNHDTKSMQVIGMCEISRQTWRRSKAFESHAIQLLHLKNIYRHIF